jgi:hypothetical protein
MIAQIETVKRNHDSIDNRKILMAAELVVRKVVLESDDYSRNVVSFGRDASLAFTLQLHGIRLMQHQLKILRLWLNVC